MPAWTQFGTAVLGGAVGAVLTQAATFIRDRLNKHEEGTFTALTLALGLEDYASECTTPIFALSNWDGSGRTPEPSGSVPALPELSDKTNWRSIGVAHASSVLGFRVSVASAQSSVWTTWEFEGNVSAYAEASDRAIELGSGALEIARRLRTAFKLGPIPPQSFDAEQFFAEQLADLKARTARQAEANATMWKDLGASSTEPVSRDESPGAEKI